MKERLTHSAMVWKMTCEQRKSFKKKSYLNFVRTCQNEIYICKTTFTGSQFKWNLKQVHNLNRTLNKFALMRGLASMILNRDLLCDDHYSDSLCDIIDPWFHLKIILKSNLLYVFAEFALLWGETQLCLPYVCLKKER